MTIPDDNPGASRYLTIKDIKEIIGPYLEGPEMLEQCIAMLKCGQALTLNGKSGFTLAFVPSGIGLYLAYMKEESDD